ncbi:rod shape-determining protein MreD [Streptococcus parasanguinis]|uniref:Rod shape-determining protein MreD n=1 Tax=Streptococcus parasanguinis TaxID=1318 RepID=A0A6L6LKS7_STRPA|nr:rod shape-determining protein MreD [Streptococcus parasanguinis]MBK5031816.1 rod shape-determining protein MreD [Streptococcus parasanguinis]MBK5173331.1 rod shape-determining protein MreD [Streptococcus parasanguinis]MBS6743343.1 rod shape-determining protein MreD [Streptococcus parasanguinis]MTR62929.1 rod shape-determining protein MreD [Streptococcus parasanguinis]MTR65418.1 rod shape-determining protein MreD [Streptococcus parasanguinis]
MKVIRKYHFFPLILFLSLFVDGQISFLISRFCPNSFEPTSFLFLYGFMLLSLYFSEIASIWWGVFFGFCFDVYFLRTIGIAFLVFPLLQVIFYRCNQIILVNRLTRFFTFLLMILIFQISTNLLLIIFIGIKFNWITLIIHQIAPSLILNVVLMIVLQPLLEKIYL